MKNDLATYVSDYFGVADEPLISAALDLWNEGLDKNQIIKALSKIWRVAYDHGWDEANYYNSNEE